MKTQSIVPPTLTRVVARRAWARGSRPAPRRRKPRRESALTHPSKTDGRLEHDGLAIRQGVAGIIMSGSPTSRGALTARRLAGRNTARARRLLTSAHRGRRVSALYRGRPLPRGHDEKA